MEKIKLVFQNGKKYNTVRFTAVEVKVVQDDDGHTYVIPEENYGQFGLWLLMEPWYQDEEMQENLVRLIDLFDTYRTDGNLPVKLYAKVGYEKETDF